MKVLHDAVDRKKDRWRNGARFFVYTHGNLTILKEESGTIFFQILQKIKNKDKKMTTVQELRAVLFTIRPTAITHLQATSCCIFLMRLLPVRAR